ncbi:50S ribosomal protein L6 [Polymorphum gilvum SL003B-26A1]|uniref:Large ribosomal subunit protein uL6 n=1 Tax=Polymorphum gilvum (strain LMG 25793 / CGMCC 1.9160 / SL003B-26A1) TaxID=991905 RepID=F2IUV2_POLGS|nr:50S ribosomal protein L6 [Polymorphum gilvum SL003B-26A1]
MPSGVTATINGRTVEVKGPKGQLSFVLNDLVLAEMTDDGIKVDPRNDSKPARSMWGMTRTMLQNLITGVSQGFEKKLDITGVGYRAQIQGNNLQLALGFSHDVLFPIPAGIDIKCPKPTEIIVSGIDKQAVGQVAANIREYRPPEPYKGKGVRYSGEFIVRKEGKKK